MKIVDMRVTPIAIADPPLFSSFGLHAPYALRTVVELVSEDGLTGAAETHGGELMAVNLERARDQVIGRDAYDLARLWRDLDHLYREDQVGPSAIPGNAARNIAPRVFGAFEVASLDLIGKAVGRPVCDLIGGRTRDDVPFSAYLFYKLAGGGGVGEDEREDRWGPAPDAAGLVAQAQAMIAAYGFGSIKLKGGVLPPEQEIEAILALRDALGPEVPLRIDPNCIWSVETSIRIGRELAGALEYLEDPTKGLPGMAAVRRGLLAEGIETPVATNEVTHADELADLVRLDAAQVLLIDHHWWGGLRLSRQIGRVCEVFGVGLSMHSNSHLGLSLLAMTHLAAATPNLTYACDTHYPWQYEADEILEGGRVPIVDGRVRVPNAPGLGAELNRDALARGRERYERCGFRARDDVSEMRKRVDPAWERMMPRW
jgi:glucarate dehydratase